MIQTLWFDFKFALRLLRRSPGFTLVAVIALGLGIGANSAVFSVVYGIALRQLPFTNSDRLVELRSTRLLPTPVDSKYLSIPKTADVIDQASEIGRLGRYMPATFAITGGAAPEQVSGLMVTPEWFEVLGVKPIRGRVFQSADLAPDQNDVVVMSHAMWQRSFGSNDDIVGTAITLSAQPVGVLVPFVPKGKPYTVIGVMPDHRDFPVDGDLWVPLRTSAYVSTMGASPRLARNVGTVARLRPDANLGQTNQELHAIAKRLAEQYPETEKDWDLKAVLLRDAASGTYRQVLELLLIAVNVVLLLACVCIGGLSVARNRKRSKEIAVRQVLGADRRRLVQQFLVESLVLGLLGGLAGIVLGQWLLSLFQHLAPPTVPRLESVGFDLWALAYTAVVAVCTGFVIGVTPAVQLTTPELGMTIRAHQGRDQTLSWFRVLNPRSFIIGVQVVLVFPLAVGSILTARSVNRLLHVDLGFRQTNVLTATVRLSSTTCAKFDACIEAFDEILERLEALPGVESAAVVGARPMSTPLALPITSEKSWDANHGTPFQAEYQIVTPRFFKTLGIPLTQGRPFEGTDNRTAAPVAIVNAALAKRLFNDQAIGKSVNMAPAGRPVAYEVVGEVGDSRDLNITKPALPTFYVPFAQSNLVPRTVLLIHSVNDPGYLTSEVAEAVHAVDKTAPVVSVETLQHIVDTQTAEPRFQVTLLACFALLGLALSVLGIYGLISYATSDRAREFGIRLALGAERWQILRLVLLEGASTLAWAVTFGLAAAALFTRTLQSQLFEVSPADIPTFVFVTVVITLAAACAYWIPARRATLIDPVIILREE